MKIDLHCHTKKIKSGEKESRNVSVESFCMKVQDADVKIIAITNHNHFDYEQFQLFSEATKQFCQIWPGVEIDVKENDGVGWHLIIIANPNNAQNFDNAVKDLFGNANLETCSFTLNEVYNSLNNFDVLYIPHFHKKPAITDKDMSKLRDLVIDDARIFHETSNNRSLGIFANHDYNVIIGSDVSDWSKYESSTFSELRLPVSSFSQFCLLSKRDKLIVDTLLNNKGFHCVTASPHKTVSINLTVYEDVNIIFGQKGTGKSEILASIYDILLKRGLKCEKYRGSEKDDDFKSLLNTKGLSRDVAKVNSKLCTQEFESIMLWSDCNPTLLSIYLDWYKTKENNANKSRMKITEAYSMPEADGSHYSKIEEDFKQIKSLNDTLSKISIDEYISHDNVAKLLKIFNDLALAIQEKLIDSFINIKSIKLVNFSIDKIKSIADKNSDTVSRPSTTGFLEFSRNRIELKRCISEIINNITNKEANETIPLGELENKGTILINSRYRMLCKDSKSDEFAKGYGIRVLRDITQCLSIINDRVFDSDVADVVNKLNEQCSETNVTSTTSFLGLSRQIVREDNTEYTPSNGERGILLLQQILQTDADAYFLDEPELGMGNSYIDTNIRPKLSDLAKRRKVVVVATHNANIAVRTLPYKSIYRTHENGQYNTYEGNPFIDTLTNINDPSDERSWTKESIHTLEGGKEAFYERKEIYESGNS